MAVAGLGEIVGERPAFVHDHKSLFAARTMSLKKNRFHNGVHNELDVAVRAFDLAIFDLHIWNEFCVSENHQGKYQL